MSERVTYHLDELIEDPESIALENLFPAGKLERQSRSIITKSGKYVCKQTRTIIANGCFDVLHPGHLSLLAHLDTIAYQMRLRPIIALNSDSSVHRLKGAGRPVCPATVRSALLNNLKWPFTVIIFEEDTPQRLMDLLRPAAVLKGNQYHESDVIKWEGDPLSSSDVITVPMADGWSTTGILRGDTR